MQNKRQKTRIYQRADVPKISKLAMNKLGKPYHQIPKLFHEQFDHLDAKINTFFLKKYRVNVSLQKLSFVADYSYKNAIIYETNLGYLGFTIDRPLLLAILDDYYGLAQNTPQEHDIDKQPMTKTEERLKYRLSQHLSELILSCYQPQLNCEIDFKHDHVAVINQWAYRMSLSLTGYQQGEIHLLFDQTFIDKFLWLLRHQQREKTTSLSSSSNLLDDLIHILPLRLNSKMASLPLTLAELLELQCGDILPITLPDKFPIFIGEEQLFTAIIAEDRGKLVLSEFHEKLNEGNND